MPEDKLCVQFLKERKHDSIVYCFVCLTAHVQDTNLHCQELGGLGARILSQGLLGNKLQGTKVAERHQHEDGDVYWSRRNWEHDGQLTEEAE